MEARNANAVVEAAKDVLGGFNDDYHVGMARLGILEKAIKEFGAASLSFSEALAAGLEEAKKGKDVIVRPVGQEALFISFYEPIKDEWWLYWSGGQRRMLTIPVLTGGWEVIVE